MSIETVALVVGLATGCITLTGYGVKSWRWSRDKLLQRRWRKSDMAGGHVVTGTDTSEALKPRAQIRVIGLDDDERGWHRIG